MEKDKGKTNVSCQCFIEIHFHPYILLIKLHNKPKAGNCFYETRNNFHEETAVWQRMCRQ